MSRLLTISRSFSVFGEKLETISNFIKPHHQKLAKFGQIKTISTTTPFPEFESQPNLKTHADLHRYSLENSDEFWSTLARSRLTWSKDFDTISDCDFPNGKIRWFEGGQLNASGDYKNIFLKKIYMLCNQSI